MNHMHDRTMSDKPWQMPGPAPKERYTKEEPYIEGGFKFWIEGEAPDIRILSVGPMGEYEVQKGTTWYPDAIHQQEQDMLREAEGGAHDGPS